jgi:hypothetical protein
MSGIRRPYGAGRHKCVPNEYERAFSRFLHCVDSVNQAGGATLGVTLAHS